MKIGDRIKERRIELGYSVDELAEKLGKNRATVYRYESNEIENLPITTLEPLAKALNTTPAHLMGWGDESGTLTISTTSLGKRIKELRQNLSLTQEELASSIGTTKQNIYKYENGIITNIPSGKIEALATELKSTPSYLMGWEDEPQDYTPPKTIAAHATEDLTEEEQEKVREYIQFLKMKRGM